LPKVGQVVVGLGVGEFFECWGYPIDRLHEADWNGTLALEVLARASAKAAARLQEKRMDCLLLHF
jgi:hypothetical protein